VVVVRSGVIVIHLVVIVIRSGVIVVHRIVIVAEKVGKQLIRKYECVAIKDVAYFDRITPRTEDRCDRQRQAADPIGPPSGLDCISDCHS